jgi:hypothetical protein
MALKGKIQSPANLANLPLRNPPQIFPRNPLPVAATVQLVRPVVWPIHPAKQVHFLLYGLWPIVWWAVVACMTLLQKIKESPPYWYDPPKVSWLAVLPSLVLACRVKVLLHSQ